MVVHPDVDGDIVARFYMESAEQWDRISDAGFRAGAPAEFEALHFMHTRRGGESVHIALVVVNRTNGDAYVEVFTRDQLKGVASAPGTSSAASRRIRR